MPVIARPWTAINIYVVIYGTDHLRRESVEWFIAALGRFGVRVRFEGDLEHVAKDRVPRPDLYETEPPTLLKVHDHEYVASLLTPYELARFVVIDSGTFVGAAGGRFIQTHP